MIGYRNTTGHTVQVVLADGESWTVLAEHLTFSDAAHAAQQEARRLGVTYVGLVYMEQAPADVQRQGRIY